MLLKKITIHKYKSFLTEQSLEVEKGITRIVGKNESGKTALLEAIAKTNYFEDNKEFKFNKDLDYPRSELTKVRNSVPEAITCEYELEDEDIAPIEDAFGVGILMNRTIYVCSLYDNTKQINGVDANLDVFKDWLVSNIAVDDSVRAIILNAESYADLEEKVEENLLQDGMNDVKARLDLIKKEAHGCRRHWVGISISNIFSQLRPNFGILAITLPCRRESIYLNLRLGQGGSSLLRRLKLQGLCLN